MPVSSSYRENRLWHKGEIAERQKSRGGGGRGINSQAIRIMTLEEDYSLFKESV